jgi:hypothetical protein
MDEKVFPAVLLDKTKALLIIEPLHFSFWHKIPASYFMIPKSVFTVVFPSFPYFLARGWIVNSLFQFFANFKVRQLFRSNLDFASGAWVPTLIGLVGAHGEISKTPNFNSLPLGQSLNHRGKNRVRNGLGVLLGERIRSFHELLDQLKLGHIFLSSN